MAFDSQVIGSFSVFTDTGFRSTAQVEEFAGIKYYEVCLAKYLSILAFCHFGLYMSVLSASDLIATELELDYIEANGKK